MVVVETEINTDQIFLKDNETNELLAIRSFNGNQHIWKSNDSKIQKVIDEWSPGSTSGGLAWVLERIRKNQHVYQNVST